MITREKCGWGVPRQFSSLGIFSLPSQLFRSYEKNQCCLSSKFTFFSVCLCASQSEIIKDRGYPVEEHFVTTKDGFILNIQRIPQGRQREASAGSKPVVFLQHGLLMDSTNWVLNSPSNSLGYILADNGYDVWLGNIRGNAYSQRHKNLEKTQSEFWNWRFVIAFFCKLIATCPTTTTATTTTITTTTIINLSLFL